MFKHAYDIATKFTLPVICSQRLFDDSVKSNLASFVILNKDGWILTAAHVLAAQTKYNNEKMKLEDYHKEYDRIKNSADLKPNQKKKLIGKLKKDNKWIKDVSYWWGANKVHHTKVFLKPKNDLALVKLENLNLPTGMLFPIIKKAKNLSVGTSLCRLGFPFHTPKSTFVEGTGFLLEEGTLPVPFFPNEGILTRFINSDTKQPRTRYIETSSPGLKGQSGGPIFDVNGVVWGIQSMTRSIDLGLTLKINRNGKEIEENQVINLGMGVHPEVIIELLEENNINYQLSEE